MSERTEQLEAGLLMNRGRVAQMEEQALEEHYGTLQLEGRLLEATEMAPQLEKMQTRIAELTALVDPKVLEEHDEAKDE